MKDMDKLMAAMNGPGDLSKPSAATMRAQKKAALAKTQEAKKLQLAKRASAKVIQMKRPAKAAAKKTNEKNTMPVRKAAANKKVIRKTMKSGKQKR